MNILPKEIQVLIAENPEQMRAAVRRFRQEPSLKEVTFIDIHGQPCVITRCTPDK